MSELRNYMNDKTTMKQHIEMSFKRLLAKVSVISYMTVTVQATSMYVYILLLMTCALVLAA